MATRGFRGLSDGRPEYSRFLDKLRRSKDWNFRRLAQEMGTPAELLERREKQLEHFFSGGSEPRAGFAKAVEEALGVKLAAEDYGWNPEVP